MAKLELTAQEKTSTQNQLRELIGDGIDYTPSTEENLREFKERHYNDIRSAEPSYTEKTIQHSLDVAVGTVEAASKVLNVHTSLLALTESNDFLNLINFYFEEEKERLSNMLTSPTPFDHNTKGELLAKLDAIRQFKLFLGAVANNADENVAVVESQTNAIEVLESILENDIDPETGLVVYQPEVTVEED